MINQVSGGRAGSNFYSPPVAGKICLGEAAFSWGRNEPSELWWLAPLAVFNGKVHSGFGLKSLGSLCEDHP